MKRLWVAFIILASLGSIYPFNFQLSELNAVTTSAFLQSCCKMLGRGDILANVILFVPIGFTGMHAARREASTVRRFLFVCLVGGIIAFLLQVMQILLPSRDENLQDVFWNVLGIAAGGVLAHLAGTLSPPSDVDNDDISLVPLVLVGTWLIYRLIPFVPSIDLQLIKDSVKPLLFQPLGLSDTIHDLTSWIVIAYLLRHARRGARLDAHVPTLMITVFCLEVLIVDNTVDKSNVIGALLAIVLWWAAQRYDRWQEGVLLVLLFGTLALTGIAPFDPRIDPVSFSWFPFHGFLDGSMYLNTQVAAEKVFLYGSLVYLFWRTQVGVVSSIVVTSSFVLAIEFSQTYLIGHTPEITDPVLVVLASVALLAIDKHQHGAALAGQGDNRSRVSTLNITKALSRVFKRNSPQWGSRSVNLKEHQFAFLASLSREMGLSVSRVMRRIIDEFIDGLEQDNALEEHRDDVDAESDPGSERWVMQTVNLRRHQIQFLDRLAGEMGVSISGATRQIVAHFISRLESDEPPHSLSVDP